MPKILMVNVAAHGHVNPTLPVLAALTDQGAEVHYLLPEGYRAAVEQRGGVFHPYDSQFGKNPPVNMPMNEMVHSLSLRLMNELMATYDDIEACVREIKPDLIIYDKFCPAARYIAQKHKIKGATFLPSYAANQHFNLGQVVGADFGPPSPDSPIAKEIKETALQIESKYGIKIETGRELLAYAESLNVCFVAKDFQYQKDTFDNSFVFVGPCMDKRESAPLSTSLDERDDKPVLFISLGTVFNAWPEFFQMCIEAFGGKNFRVLMAIGKQVDPATLGQIPENFEIAPHLPQLEILPRTQVFVSHGGMNSTMEALWYGVPLVVIPQMAEQMATAMRVDELKLGSYLWKNDVTATMLENTVDRLIADHGLKERLLDFQKKIRTSGGQVLAAKRIVEACR